MNETATENMKVWPSAKKTLEGLKGDPKFSGKNLSEIILSLHSYREQAKAEIEEITEENIKLLEGRANLLVEIEKLEKINEALRNKDPQAEKERTKTTLQKNRLAHEVSENEKDRELKAAIAALEALRDERRNKWQTFRQVAKDIPVDELSKELLGNSGMTAVKAILGDTKEGAE